MRSLYAEGAPPMLRMAVVVLGVEALGVTAIAIAQAVEVATGKSYQASSGLALAVLELIVAVGLAVIAKGMAQLRPWTRTPGVMTQICVGLLGIILWQASRQYYAVPALVLAIAGLVGLFHPASLRALRRHFGDDEDTPPAKQGPVKQAPAKQGPAKGSTSKQSPAKQSPAKGSSAKPAQASGTKGGAAKRSSAKR